jgi:hypothetical protein
MSNFHLEKEYKLSFNPPYIYIFNVSPPNLQLGLCFPFLFLLLVNMFS